MIEPEADVSRLTATLLHMVLIGIAVLAVAAVFG